MGELEIGAIDSQQVELWERIQRFSFDRVDAQLSFSKRLARENGWSLAYALRVIEEYRKFVFLAIVAGHPVTPSDQVDQVWHLHLSYSRSYWEEFCPQVLQTALHHDPTMGGKSENEKFEDWYRKTLESYERFFAQKPPIDIWSPPSVRFGQELHFVRANTKKSWVLPKLELSAAIVTLIAVTVIVNRLYIIRASESISNPLAKFLLNAIVITVGFVLLAWVVDILNLLKNPQFRLATNKNDSSDGDTDFGGWSSWGDSSCDSGDCSDGGGDSGGCGGCGGCGGYGGGD